jgi:hypothetical protein
MSKHDVITGLAFLIILAILIIIITIFRISNQFNWPIMLIIR